MMDKFFFSNKIIATLASGAVCAATCAAACAASSSIKAIVCRRARGSSAKPRQRSIRRIGFIETKLDPQYSRYGFRDSFRMERASFLRLAETVRSSRHTHINVYSVELRTAVFLYRICHGMSFRSIEDITGVSKSQCDVIILQ